MNVSQIYVGLDTGALHELIRFCKTVSGINESILEKDLYLTGLLKKTLALSPDKDNIYFKGGTALAKCHHIVDRFSEDIDLFVFSGDLNSSKTKEDNLNKRVTHVLLDTYPEDILPGGKRGGDYNKIQMGYDMTFSNSGFKPHVEFEISSCALRDKSRYSVEYSTLSAQSIIGEILDKTGNTHLTKRFGLEAFPVRCLSPEKSLCDKISRMIRVSYDDDPAAGMVQYIRDAYDIAMFLADKRFSEFIASPDFLEKMYVTNLEDSLRASSHALEKYSDAVLFLDPAKIFLVPGVKAAYENVVDSFVFDPQKAPSLNAVITSFSVMHPAMKRFDAYRQEQEKVPAESRIQDKDRDALLSLGLTGDQIERLRQDGSLETENLNYRPAEAWDGNVPKEKGVMTFTFHDGSVFVRHPDGNIEKPILDMVRNHASIASFSSLKKRKEIKKTLPSLQDKKHSSQKK